MAREALEEAGITIEPSSLKLVHTVHRLSRGIAGQERIDLFFETYDWQGEIINAEPNKCDHLAWFPLTDMPNNMLPLVRNVLNDISQGVRFSEYAIEVQ